MTTDQPDRLAQIRCTGRVRIETFLVNQAIQNETSQRQFEERQAAFRQRFEEFRQRCEQNREADRQRYEELDRRQDRTQEQLD